MLKPFEEMTSEDYAKIGLKAGLEVHQQLNTQKKLFCRCPAGLYSEEYDAEILRHMRPTLSELGEYDGTALMEFKTKKDIIYQLNKNTVCTYEMDDAPPFELNQEALEIALEITLLLKCNLVSEIHIARKQYLDGSIPTGFQRTTILGIDGEIPYKGRKIGIIQLGLEEDACREVSDIGHTRVYKTDRLGMPLIEVVTYPDMHTPQEVAEVGQIIRQLTRATTKVNRGIGAARQDVNVSIRGGTRVEIKGVSRIPLIPLLIHIEAGRQKALLEIKEELHNRGLTTENFKTVFFDLTDILRNTSYLPIKNVISDKLKNLSASWRIKCAKLPQFNDILKYPTQPGNNFAKEISDRVRVIACLDEIPNIIHSDSEDITIGSANWLKIKKLTELTPEDALVIVWGNEQDVETALKEITIRATEALIGVPNETRQDFIDGTTAFERILPGPDRMYPDTDLPPIALTEERIESIRKKLPEFPWDRRERYRKFGLKEYVIDDLLLTHKAVIFDKIVTQLDIEPTLVADFLVRTLKHLKRKKLPVDKLENGITMTVFEAYKRKKIIKDAIPKIFEDSLTNLSVPIENILDKFKILQEADVSKMIKEAVDELNVLGINDFSKRKAYLMGLVMTKANGRINGKTVAQLVNKYYLE